MEKAKSYNGFSGEIIAEITTLEKSENFSTFIVKTRKIGNDDIRVKIAFTTAATEENFKEGDIVTIGGKIHTEFNSSLSYNAEKSYACKSVFLLLDEEYIVKTDYTPNHFRQFIYSLRESALSQTSSLNNSGLISALAVGNKSALDLKTKADFQKLGLSHSLAVSGMHLSILIMSLYMFLKKRSVGKYVSCVICSFLVVVYMVLTGLSFSIMRAGIMMIIYFASTLVRRQSDSVTTLFTSALFILAQNPWAVFDTGFQLSFFSTLGILVFSPKIMEKVAELKLLSKKLKDNAATVFMKKCFRKVFLSATLIFVTSLSATLSTLPLTLLHFKSFNPLSILSNICVLFLINFLLVVSITHISVASILPPLAIVTKFICDVLSDTIVDFTHFLADVFPEPFFFSPEVSRAIAYPCAVILLFSFIFFKRRRALFVVTLIISVTVSITYGLFTHFTRDYIYVTFSTSKSCRDVIIEERGHITLISFPCDDVSYHSLTEMLDYRNIHKIDKAIFVTGKEIPLTKVQALVTSRNVESIAFASYNGVFYENKIKALEEAVAKKSSITFIETGDLQIGNNIGFGIYPNLYTYTDIKTDSGNMLIFHSLKNGYFSQNVYLDYDAVVLFGESKYFPQITPSIFYLCDKSESQIIQSNFEDVNEYDYYFIKITSDGIKYSKHG